jgi:outer membrane protein assembly factor BamE (lipoprotein component of BamABCDE complex)
MKTFKSIITILSVFTLSLALGACMSQRVPSAGEGDKFTLGKVQREIRIGMPSSQVAEILGSPNIVTTDDHRNEVWIYDKAATEVSGQRGSDAWTIILAGSSTTKDYAKRSQRTLTVVIKFDKQQRVRDFSYHSSSF